MMDKAAGRIPPQNIEAEQAVLGCMLLDQSAVYTAVNILKDTDFYRKDHGEIFNAMLSLFMESQPIDVITVADNDMHRAKRTMIRGNVYGQYIYTGFVRNKSRSGFRLQFFSDMLVLSGTFRENTANVAFIQDFQSFSQRRQIGLASFHGEGSEFFEKFSKEGVLEQFFLCHPIDPSF
jgi:hypothetical protein